jgi:hypothetical protein
MTIADEILDLLKRKRRLKLTAIDIAEMLYWEDKTFKRRVSADCLTLYEQNRLTRDGKGSAADPYVYGISSTERRNHQEEGD